MERFVHFLSTFTASLMIFAVPIPTLAIGLGLGSRQALTVAESDDDSSDTDSKDVQTTADLDIKVANRCKHLLTNDRTQCERSVRAQISARGNADARHSMRAAHGKLMSGIRHRMKEMSEHGKEPLARIRNLPSDFKNQLHAALKTEVELVLKVCKDKVGDEHDKCVADAKVRLQTKVNAAIEAMKK